MPTAASERRVLIGAGSGSIQSIQILRAVAALGVVCLHICNEAQNRLGVHNPLPGATIGAAGVDLFFVISGFIMVYASASMFGQPGAPLAFFKRRLIRIVPLYWAVTVATIGLFVVLNYTGAVEQLTAGTIASSFLFIPYARPDGEMFPVQTLGWTLNYEMMFYVIFAIALALPRRSALVVVLVLGAMAAVGSAINLPQPLAYWCDPIILEFCFGIAIAVAFRKGWRLPAAAVWGLIAVGVLALVAMSIALPGMSRPIRWGLPAAALVAAAALAEHGGASRRWLPLAILGDASYSLYLTHILVILLLPSVAYKLNIDVRLWPWSYIATLVVGSLGASLTTYFLFERPVTRALQQWLISRPAAAEGERLTPQAQGSTLPRRA